MYRQFLWKTFCLGKTAEMRRAARTAGKTFLQMPSPAGKTLSVEKILVSGEIKSLQFVAKPGEIWYTLFWIIINKIKRSGAALPARNGRSIKKMEERNQPRRPRRDAEQPQQKNESLIYGKNPVTELLKSGSGVDTVLIAEGMAPAVAAYYTALAKEAGATVKRVHPNKLRLMTGTESHQGVAAFASEIE